MKRISLSSLILLGIGLLIVVMLVIVISQFITIQEKRQQLNNLTNYSTELAGQIASAEKTLEIVSTLEYQELEARKHGYTYPDDKRFVASENY